MRCGVGCHTTRPLGLGSTPLAVHCSNIGSSQTAFGLSLTAHITNYGNVKNGKF